MIDQTTLGHQSILAEFGEAANPTIGWQLDPFGHSATQAALLSAEVGFDGLFFGRIDYQDHDLRVKNRDLQFVWAPSPSLGPHASVYTEASLDGNCTAAACASARFSVDEVVLVGYSHDILCRSRRVISDNPPDGLCWDPLVSCYRTFQRGAFAVHSDPR